MAYTGNSLVDYLGSVGKASDFTSRSSLAGQNGIQNYTGTADQNTQLLSKLNTPTSTAISANGLSTPSVANVPLPPTPGTQSGEAASAANAALAANTKTLTQAQLDAQNAANPPTATGGSSLSDLFKEYLGAQAPPPSLSTEYQQLQDASGYQATVDAANQKAQATKAAQAKLAAVQAQIQGITAEGTAQNLLQENTYGSTGITAGQQAENTRNAAIRAIPYQVQALAAQAEVASAQGDQALAESIRQQTQDHIDKIFQIQAQDSQNQYTYQQGLIKSVYDFASKQQQAELDQLKQDKQNSFTSQQATMNDIRTVASNLVKTDPSAAGKLIGLDPNSKTYTQDAQRIISGARTEASSTVSNYSGDFASTITAAANNFGTLGQQKNVTTALQQAIAQKDYPSAYQYVVQSTAQGLTAANQTKFENAAIDNTLLQSLKSKLQGLADKGYNTSLLTGSADTIQRKIGALKTDPKYAEVATELDRAFQQYRQNMTGAAFGAAESSQYASVLPSKSNTLALNLAIIDGALAYNNDFVEGAIKNSVGQGGVYIKQYAEGAQNQPVAPVSVSSTDSQNRPTSGSVGGISYTITY